ncbi:zinc finger protein-like 1-like [Quillaja saponaria]|uniref:Zinc finger protein-like 1-like n=1 Tax=Quillaja saponaria TaxID=32244 RepID=A0AAD7M0B1_QUISA|nr:zinc finger protein-like 1-like [Quillaja saponaria]
MVVCKCRKATKLYCFVHKVPVCGECICFPDHQICVVRTYSEWVIDGEYDWPPKCCLCQAVLDEETGPQTTRLGCMHVIHTNCFASHMKSFPPHTAPGRICVSNMFNFMVWKNKFIQIIWPPKSVKDSGSRLHSKLKEAIMQTGLEKNFHPVSLPVTESRSPPPAFASDPLISRENNASSTSSANNEINLIEVLWVIVPPPERVDSMLTVQNSEISYYADDEDGNRKKYTRRGPFRHKFLRALLPFWSTPEGRTRHQRSSRMDPSKILLVIAIMACLATMGILYYRLVQRGFGEELPDDEQR